MSQPPPSPGGNAQPQKKRAKQQRSKSGVKVRMKLPPIESYEKEVEFRAEGPGRVIVRLERLMGSDRIRLTDPKYMSELLQKLEEEEHKDWVKRTRIRKKAEHTRSRQLAIEGLMDPADDMQDLYKHPVFRVNRVLKRLQALDANMSLGQNNNLPPIEEIEPFEFDRTGAIFKSYPKHAELKSQHTFARLSDRKSRATLPMLAVSVERASGDYDDEEEDGEEEEEEWDDEEWAEDGDEKPITKIQVSRRKTEDKSESEFQFNVEADEVQEEGDNEGDEEGEEGDGELAPVSSKKRSDASQTSSLKIPSSEDQAVKKSSKKSRTSLSPSIKRSQASMTEAQKKHSYFVKVPSDVSLTTMQKRYGIPADEDLTVWGPHRSDLVETLYADNESDILQLYQNAEDILGVYERENITVDEFVKKLGRLMGAGGGATMST